MQAPAMATERGKRLRGMPPQDADGAAPQHAIIVDSDDDEEAGDVVVLTTENFDEIVSKSKFALVRFYCGDLVTSRCPLLFTNYARRLSFMHRGAVIAR